MNSQPESASGQEHSSSPKEIGSCARQDHILIPILIFMLSVVIVLALPSIIGSQKKARTASIKGGLRTIQIAAESYATDSGGSYPAHFHEMLPFFPGGGNLIGGAPGKLPNNVLPKDVIDLGPLQRNQFDDWLKVHGSENFKPGKIIFCGIRTGRHEKCDGYAVVGVDESGHAIGGIGGKLLVFSNL